MHGDDPVQMAVATFSDDDRFLHKFLPGSSARMRQLRTDIHRANIEENRALIPTILLTGESGAGKYRAAQVIAGNARWNKGDFSPDEPKPSRERKDLNAPIESYSDRMGDLLLTNIPEPLAETELFGNVAGAYTDAHGAKPGIFGDPAYDHVLLDEIGDAPLSIQGKLLAVLEGRQFVPVGGSAKDRKFCDKRILMATLRDLKSEVRERRFREDLFRRVTRWVIRVPALREIPESIPNIARQIFQERCPKRWKDKGLELAVSDLEWAQGQQWPGNIRELKDAIEDWISGIVSGERESLREVARRRDDSRIDAASRRVDVQVEVRSLIEEILSDKRPSMGTIGAFTSVFTKPIEEAVQAELYAWYSEIGADREKWEKCMKLFGDGKWDSIKSTMSSIKRTIMKAR